jgi:glyoxylase-like metal-dependent hydrolase (beta-lactamase superfamily II)
MTATIERITTAGTFNLDGDSFQVENNVWLIGNDTEVIVVDAPHELDPILEAIGHRRVEAVICTHAHDDHVTVAPQLGEKTGAPVLLHPFDRVLWDMTHPATPPTGLLAEGDVLHVGGVAVEVLHTPGHAPGAVSLDIPALGVVITGDTLFQGGPGATGRSHSDFETILTSIRTRLLVLPPETRVLPGHGEETTIGIEAPSYEEWVRRGH